VVNLTKDNAPDFKTELRKLLRTNRLGKTIHLFDELDSTQDLANALPIMETMHGTIVIAKKQKMGKGRIGRSWISPEGGLWMSIIFRPEFDVNSIVLTQFIGALAVSKAIMEIAEIRCSLKWPNDVLINEKKVCGILVDVNLQSNNKVIVMGIGLNANIDPFLVNNNLNQDSIKATSLTNEYGSDIDLVNLTKAIIDNLEYYYYDFLSTERSLEIIDLWKKNSDIIGKTAIVKDGNEKVVGRVIDIDKEGSLLMKLDDSSIKRVTYYSGVTFR
jgi:BirA family transcriptional regulator, biotin operon repressor / biotin---[acetyl-CoA-carboxylase] ligase